MCLLSPDRTKPYTQNLRSYADKNAPLQQNLYQGGLVLLLFPVIPVKTGIYSTQKDISGFPINALSAFSGMTTRYINHN